MFERFTKDARATVRGAVEHAERTGADTVTEEHLLLALLDQDGGRASFAITALGLADRRDSLAAALAEARRRGGMSKADAEALADIGIDLAEVVSRIEETHGEGPCGATAADGGGGPAAGRSPGRRRRSWRSRCASRSAGATGSSAGNTCCWPSPRCPARSPTSSRTTA